jgi:hypothetical protein
MVPAKDYLTINMFGWKGTVNMQIYNLSGKLIKTIKTQSVGQFRIDVSKLSAGIYLMRVFDNAGHAQSVKWKE